MTVAAARAATVPWAQLTSARAATAATKPASAGRCSRPSTAVASSVGQRGGLRDDQQRGQPAEDREHGEVAPGRGDPAQQTRVERAAVHQYTGALPSVRPRNTHQHIA